MALRRQTRARSFQERKNVLEIFDDSQLVRRYRMDRAGIIFVTDLVRNVITPSTSQSNAISAELKTVMMLRFLATGKMQQCNADDLGPSEPTIGRVVMETIMALTAAELATEHGGEQATTETSPTEPDEISSNCTQVCGRSKTGRSCSKICLIQVYP